MKKFYAFAAAAMVALGAFAQDGAPLYATGAGGFDNGEWNPKNPDQFEYADGVYTLEIPNLTQLKISTVAGGESGWDGFNTGVLGCSYGDEPGVAVALEAGYDANIAAPWKGDYKITVAGDLSTITLSTDTPKPEGDTPIYLRGDMNGWGATAEWQFVKVGVDSYKFEFAEGQQIAFGESFKIADADWNEINAGGDGSSIPLDFEYEVFNGGNPANMTLEEECNGVIWFRLNYEGANYLYATNDKDAEAPFFIDFSGSSVETIAAQNGAAQYFNLQGQRVANPSNGLFIVVKDGKAVKQVVK